MNSVKDIEFDVAFGQRLVQLRLAKGVSQVELAEHLGINKRTLCSYEKGIRRLPITFLPKIAERLQLSCDEILDFSAALDGRSSDAKLMKRFQRLVELPSDKRQPILSILDTLLAAAR
jgi:transcriptional regulator with XRE-family HTH domain